MHIKEVTIDGFKSYAQKVVVRNFDRNFNAITGLNGSGKSNILDAICFVLGMKNLAKVRVTNLQELIYKQGQAGVTKATVSITFDNTDPEAGPPQYKHMKEIIVTRTIHAGKDQFLINSQKAQASRVQDMFHSVQLNVNNPHFLIMQGRITKVLNMRPIEILGLLEEAAGTTMYNKKRDAARKTLDRKRKQLEEIDEYVANDMTPAMERLEAEKKHYTEWQEACAKFDTLDHLVVAYRFWRMLQHHKKHLASAEAAVQKLVDCDAQKCELEEEQKLKQAEIEAAQNQLQLMSNGKVREVSARCDELGLQVAKQQGVVESRNDDVAALTLELQRLLGALEEISEEKVQAALQGALTDMEASAAALVAVEAEYEAAKCEVSGAESGDGRDANNRSLPERLRDIECLITQNRAEVDRAQLAMEHLQDQLCIADADCKKKLQDDAKITNELKGAQRAVKAAQQAVDEVPVDLAEIAQLERAARQAQAAVHACQDKCHTISAAIGHNLNFNYDDPQPGFDRKSVKGVLARLVRVKDTHHATALEVAAGAKLHHVVVDTDQVGRELLKHGGLRRRVTIVPLNKTRAHVIATNKQQQAARATNGRATLALELVGYEREVEVAMQHAFGSSFVCQDTQAAQKVAFSRDIFCRGISIQGDDFNPAGTVSGGSRGKGIPVLARLTELQQCEHELSSHQDELRQMQSRLSEVASARRQHQDAMQQLDLTKHALRLVEGRASCSAGHQAQKHADDLRNQLEDVTAKRDAAGAKIAELEEKAEDLQNTISLLSTDRGAVVKAAKMRMAKAETSLRKARDLHAEKAEQVNLKRAEQECAAEERTSLNEQLDTIQRDLVAAEERAQTVQADLKKLTVEWREAEEEAHVLKEGLSRYSEDVTAAKHAAEDIQRHLSNLAAENIVLTKKREKCIKEVESVQQMIDAAEKTHPRLVKDKGKFGEPGGRYDFDNLDMKLKNAEHQEAQEVKKHLEPRVNKSVPTMYETMKATYSDIESRRQVVEKDKQSIEEVIEKLDAKRDEQVEDTWHKVSATFSKIFSILLPGTEARLEPPEGCQCLDGLEVRVAFGGVWKDSLSELSGGQRSLLTLSLILALLEFRPAPMYILDEVDAALDLSHTQNIGKLISERFPSAQFLIVSLKEGMFNNANVLFRTHFVNGASTVQRTARLENARASRQTGDGGDVRPTPAKKGRAMTSRKENRVLADL
eukprot:jgi/Ulvmu1/4032/UM019_0009.1